MIYYYYYCYRYRLQGYTKRICILSVPYISRVSISFLGRTKNLPTFIVSIFPSFIFQGDLCLCFGHHFINFWYFPQNQQMRLDKYIRKWTNKRTICWKREFLFHELFYFNQSQIHVINCAYAEPLVYSTFPLPMIFSLVSFLDLLTIVRNICECILNYMGELSMCVWMVMVKRENGW